MIKPIFLTASVLCASASVAVAQSCTLENDYCVPFVGCTENGQNYYFGNTFGKREGPVFAISADGVKCEGKWWRTSIGAGKATFSCEDGTRGRSTYTYMDGPSGTILGRGRLKGGDRLRFWSGHKILPYVLADKQERQEMISCVTGAIKTHRSKLLGR